MFIKLNRKVHTVFIHCSASDNPKHDDISVIKRWHQERGFADVGYHYFIKKDGTLQAGRPIENRPASQAPFNSGSISICLHGLEKDKFTPEQFDTLVTLCNDINRAYDGKLTFRGHCEVNKKKTCPVFDYKRVLNLDENGYIIKVSKVGFFKKIWGLLCGKEL